MPGVTSWRLTNMLSGAVITTAILTTVACSGSKSDDKGAQVSQRPGCDIDVSRGLVNMMSDPRMGKVTEKDGHITYQFAKKEYANLTSEQRKDLTVNFAQADSCLHKKMRVIEFKTPTGDIVGHETTDTVSPAL